MEAWECAMRTASGENSEGGKLMKKSQAQEGREEKVKSFLERMETAGSSASRGRASVILHSS